MEVCNDCGFEHYVNASRACRMRTPIAARFQGWCSDCTVCLDGWAPLENTDNQEANDANFNKHPQRIFVGDHIAKGCNAFQHAKCAAISLHPPSIHDFVVDPTVRFCQGTHASKPLCVHTCYPTGCLCTGPQTVVMFLAFPSVLIIIT